MLLQELSENGIVPSEQEKLEQASKQIVNLASEGLIASVDPDVADFMASFDEDALSPEEAEESIYSVDLSTGIVVSFASDLAGEAA